MNTKQKFINAVIEQFGFLMEDAELIYNYYLKERILKIDKVNGGFSLSHGTFWDKKIMNLALILEQKKQGRFKK